MGYRIEGSFPRGGLGYWGFLPAIGSIAAGLFLAAPPGLVVTICLCVLTTWFAVGLRRDGNAGEKIDTIVFEEQENLLRFRLFDRTEIYRVSTLMFVGGLAGVALCVALIFVQKDDEARRNNLPDDLPPQFNVPVEP